MIAVKKPHLFPTHLAWWCCQKGTKPGYGRTFTEAYADWVDANYFKVTS